MKYFFLSNGWTYARIWEFGGLWDENSWRRKPHIERLNLAIVEHGEILWLYQVEDAVLMVEVEPENDAIAQVSPFGQVILKRLITAEQVIELIGKADSVVNEV